MLFTLCCIAEIGLYVKFKQALSVVAGLLVAFWGSLGYNNVIDNACKIWKIRAIFSDFGGICSAKQFLKTCRPLILLSFPKCQLEGFESQNLENT